ncbi:MAG TPA: UV DNA damage repair endonuclease UvsE [Smithella sp.]|mgnify:CR=1 FL=1|nr:UV DNA damage repair endonuclease UvsE [Smithella sp.]MDM7987913.1 UV DNA damage repair endonuclease UvsE [Smithella sp.]HNY50598.1 UV DNA damage repair endonuclease UvsE [Smithella sp.]HOG89165.1 UV DNA damage repair endonuclease UvsE [Smithella sp.]HOU51707.1 UV DNA damage repair endonuclease UvsE [Smithella sp.]
MRFGLCCLFKKEPVSFRTATAKSLLALVRDRQLEKLSEICFHNASNLYLALQTVDRLGIGAFRIMSPLFPRMTHPVVGYRLEDLPQGNNIRQKLEDSRIFARKHDIRLSFHPDQFVVLSSPHAQVVENSIRELEYQGMLADAVGADVINIHAGGAYGDKSQTLQRLKDVLPHLSAAVRKRLTLENDDASYTPRDLLPFCERFSIPFVYDVHHHRCNPDDLSVEQVTTLAEDIWKNVGKELYGHISSPRSGWQGGNPKSHAAYIDQADFPACWSGRKMTVDVEAKAKELAVMALMDGMKGHLNAPVPCMSSL